MIQVIEYHHLNVVTAHHQLQSQKRQSLIEKPTESRVGTKLVEKTVLFAIHAQLQYALSARSTSHFYEAVCAMKLLSRQKKARIWINSLPCQENTESLQGWQASVTSKQFFILQGQLLSHLQRHHGPNTQALKGQMHTFSFWHARQWFVITTKPS